MPELTMNKTVAIITSLAFVVIALLGAGYALFESSDKLDTTMDMHSQSPESHIHLRHAVIAVSEMSTATHDSIISFGVQLRSMKELLQEIRDNGN